MESPTIKDVARVAGVSISAVSMFLNGKDGIGKAAQERIALAIETLGYVPRHTSRKENNTQIMGLLVEKLPLTLRGDHFYADVTMGMQAEGERLGYHFAIGVLNKPTRELPSLLNTRNLAGVIAMGGGDVTDELLHQILKQGLPLITVDNHSASDRMHSVEVNNFQGAYDATQHLIALGHQRIAIIRGPEKYKSLTERYYGYCQAMLEAGLSLDSTLIQQSLSTGVPRKGYFEMQRLLENVNRPTAIFAVSDRTALGAIDVLRENGLRVPENISMAGFDDMDSTSYAPPALTTVSTARYEMGVVTVQRLHTLIGNPAQTPVKMIMYSTLLIRDSTVASSLL